MLGQPQCCINAQQEIEWKVFSSGNGRFVLLHDEFFTALRFCPFCGAELSLESWPYQAGKGEDKGRICFDIDGVLAVEEGPYASREAYQEAIRRLNRLTAAGYEIVYQTARYMKKYAGDSNEAYKHGFVELYDWLINHGFPHGQIYMGKPSAIRYVDDKGFQIRSERGTTDWDRLFAQLGIR